MSIVATYCSASRWEQLCTRLQLKKDKNIYQLLVKAHHEKHRAYHTLDHIAACLRHLDSVKSQIDRPDEIEMALWFHDAIYKPFSSTNEEDSAKWAVSWLSNNGADKMAIDRIEKHILATKSHHTPDDSDGRYILDIDLSILGTAPDIYDEFEYNVRQEYKRVPKIIFQKKRKAILNGFLIRPNIYVTAHFQTLLETQARQNITRAIARL